MKKSNVLVCGTGYGKIYLSLFFSESDHFHLSGLLAQGSMRSQEISRGFGIPLYKSVEEVPDDIDIACVAVKATIMGGDGTKIAIKLMAKGINVIQEHPIHPSDIQKCLNQAKKYGVCYHVNSHYVNVRPVRIFVDYIQKAINHETPLFIEITTSLSYSMIDILGYALGKLEPFGFTQPIKWPPELVEMNKTGLVPFQCLQGVIAGIPVTLKFQNLYEKGRNFDDNLLVMHRICVGLPSGNLTLVNTHGPIIWSDGHVGKAFVEPQILFDDQQGYFSKETKSSMPSAISFSNNNPPSLYELATNHWRKAIHVALSKIRDEMASGKTPFEQSGEYLKNVSRVWMEINRCCGAPQVASLPEPTAPNPDPIEYSKSIGDLNNE